MRAYLASVWARLILVTIVVVLAVTGCSPAEMPEQLTTREANAAFVEDIIAADASFAFVPESMLYELGHAACDVMEAEPDTEKAKALLIENTMEQGYSMEFGIALVNAATSAYCPWYS